MDDALPDRLVPLDLWISENARARSIWQSGSPRLGGPEDMGKWLRRHEQRLTRLGAVMRLGNAWRIIEPRFRPVMMDILVEERNAKSPKEWSPPSKASRSKKRNPLGKGQPV